MEYYLFNHHYQRIQPLHTNDLLTAVKVSVETQSDLYEDDQLIVSWKNDSFKGNVRRLKTYGIKTVCWNGNYLFNWIDETKNSHRVFAHFYPYKWKGMRKLQVFVYDYCDGMNYLEFESIQELKGYIQIHFHDIDEQSIVLNVINGAGALGANEYNMQLAN